MMKEVNERRSLWERILKMSYHLYTVSHVFSTTSNKSQISMNKNQNEVRTDKIRKSCRTTDNCRNCSSRGATEVVVEFMASGKKFL